MQKLFKLKRIFAYSAKLEIVYNPKKTNKKKKAIGSLQLPYGLFFIHYLQGLSTNRRHHRLHHLHRRLRRHRRHRRNHHRLQRYRSRRLLLRYFILNYKKIKKQINF